MKNIGGFHIFLASLVLCMLVQGCASTSSYSICNPGDIPSGFSSWSIAESPYFPEVQNSLGKGLAHERTKIKYLLGHTREADQFRFDRNGHAFDAKTTANHLTKKYRERYKEIITAKMFIDEIATRSSESGRDYYALDENNQAYRTGDLLHHELTRLERHLQNI